MTRVIRTFLTPIYIKTKTHSYFFLEDHFNVMLSQRLQGPTSASLARPALQRQSNKMDDTEDFVQVFDKKLRVSSQAVPSSSSSRHPQLSDVRSDHKSDSKTAVLDRKASQSTYYSPDAKDGYHPTSIDPCSVLVSEEERILRSTLLGSRNSPLGGVKRFYGFLGGATPTTGVEFGYFLNNMAVGSGSNQRTGTQIHCKHLKMRFLISWWHANALFTSTAVPPPVLRMVAKINRIPAAPGTTEICFATDSNPPGLGPSLFSSLGVNPSTAVNALLNAVWNPASQETYHMLREQTLPPLKVHSSANEAVSENPIATLATGQTYSTPTHAYQVEWNIPLDIKSVYTTVSGIYPAANALEWTCLAIFDTYVNMAISWTSELHYEDVLDG